MVVGRASTTPTPTTAAPLKTAATPAATCGNVLRVRTCVYVCVYV